MNFKQIAIVAVGVAVLAAGIGFVVANFGGIREKVQPTPGPPLDKAPLLIATDLNGALAREAYTAGHHAFRYKSRVDQPLLVGVNWKNCKCARVEICVAPDEWKELSDTALIARADDPSLQWTSLVKDGEGFTIPPRAIGWVRIGWNADKSGDVRFSTELWLYGPDDGIGFPLQVEVHFEPAVHVGWAADLEKTLAPIGQLGVGEQREGLFLFWSTTRDKFTLQKAPPREDACVSYGDPVALSPKELEGVSKPGRKALSGYRVEIAVRERVDKQQLDLGPFRRELVWKTDASKEPLTAYVAGIVLGEVVAVVAGNKPDNPRLDMGGINPNRPAVFTLRLNSNNADVELTPDSTSAEFLKVDMLDGKAGKIDPLGRKTWTVNVSYRPDSGFRGRFPDRDRPGYEHCFVTFRVSHAGAKDEQPRRIRVPVAGQVRN